MLNRKKLALVFATIPIVTGAALGATEVRWRRRFEAPYPSIAATTDAGTIERGRYLVYSAAACAYCHVPREQWPSLDSGAMLPLGGNHVFRLPFGEFFSPNLTPDAQTGISSRTDGELSRVLRYGVRADGRAAFPFMAFHQMADDDLAAILSFLRSRPPVWQEVPEHRLSLLGKTIMAFALTPSGPQTSPRPTAPRGPSVERGEYLANHVSSCVECHSDRSRRDGSFVGPPFAGGQRMDIAADPAKVAVPPNLTPDPETSPVGRWTEDAFIIRFRQGALIPGTPMPWGAFARMTEDDLRSIFRYLRTLPPVRHATGPTMQDKESGMWTAANR